MTEEKCAYIYSEKLSCELDKILKIRGRVSRKLFFNFSLTVKFMILSRYHFQIIVTHRYTPVPRSPPLSQGRRETVRDGGAGSVAMMNYW